MGQLDLTVAMAKAWSIQAHPDLRDNNIVITLNIFAVDRDYVSFAENVTTNLRCTVPQMPSHVEFTRCRSSRKTTEALSMTNRRA
jgi:hypothetical protein